MGDNNDSQSDSQEDFYSGNDKFHQAPDDGENEGVRKWGLNNSANNLKLMMGKQQSNSIFREKSRLTQTPLHAARTRILSHQAKSMSDPDYKLLKPDEDDEQIRVRKILHDIVDESNKSAGSSISSPERTTALMPNETKASNGTFGGKISQFPSLHPSPSRMAKGISSNRSQFQINPYEAGSNTRNTQS